MTGAQKRELCFVKESKQRGPIGLGLYYDNYGKRQTVVHRRLDFGGSYFIRR